MAHFWTKMPFLAIGGRGGPKWLVQVEQIVVHIGGGLLWTQNLSEKCTQRFKNGPKMALFWPKMSFFAIGGREAPNGLCKLNKWWYTLEHI